MKKILSGGLLVTFMLGLMAFPGLSQNAKQVLEKVIDAQGGRKQLAAIKDSTTTADFEIPQMGLSGTGTMYTKEPNMQRLDMEFMGMLITQAFDGETAWSINPQSGAAEELPAEVQDIVRNSSYGNAAFLNPEKFGITHNLRGKESFEGKEYLLLERAFTDGYTITLFVDPETYLIHKTRQKSFNEMLAEITEEVVMTDYKKVNGIMTPHTLSILRDGEEFAIMTVTEMSFNTGLEDSFFKRE